MDLLKLADDCDRVVRELEPKPGLIGYTHTLELYSLVATLARELNELKEPGA